MLPELRADDAEKSRHAFASLRCHLAVESIIQGLTPATIFVDDRETPTAAITWFKGRAWLAGSSDSKTFTEALPRLLDRLYFRRLRHHGARGFVLYYGSADWKSQLAEVFKNMPRTEALRYHYWLDPTARSQDVAVPEDVTLHRINSSLLTKKHLHHLADLGEELQSERPTVDEFLLKSFGYCAVIGDVLVGWCTSEYNVSDQCELGIFTVDGYRRRGIATLTATAVIKQALSAGIHNIGWHCYADNEPSIATAEKLGFTKHCQYPVCRITV